MRDLGGATAILTGASRGLGVQIARALAAEGVHLALAARSPEGLEAVRSTIEAPGTKTVCIPTDVADPAQREALVERATAELGPVDILVNNAGIESLHRFEDYPPEDIGKLIEVNLTAPMALTRLVLPGMLERGRGHIVNLASLAGKAGVPCAVPYGASKAGLIVFTRGLRAELLDTLVGCSAVCPGYVAGVGMYADVANESGIEAPRVMGTSKPGRVASAVVRSIKRDLAEVIVNPSPMRPLLALAEVAPGLVPHIHRTLGITKMGRRTSDALKR